MAILQIDLSFPQVATSSFQGHCFMCTAQLFCTLPPNENSLILTLSPTEKDTHLWIWSGDKMNEQVPGSYRDSF